MKKKLLFGIYHTDCRKGPGRFRELAASDFINVFLVEGGYRDQGFDENFEVLKQYPEKGVFISVSDLGFHQGGCAVADVGETMHVPECVMYPDYRERIDAMLRYLKEKDYYKQVIGLYMDEPMLWGVTNDQLEEFTRYFRVEAAPDKRFFICFSLAGVAPDFWTIDGAQAVTPESTRYLTDVAFDMYHKWSSDYEAIYREMMERTGNREDLRVWFIPCTMDYRGNKTEEHCLEHLENCYALLKRTKHPGGLMCYTYHTFPSDVEALGNVGLDLLTDPTYPKYWPRLYERVEQIGHEMISG